MSESRHILLLMLLFPALALGQTVHFEKDRVAYKGKMEFQGSNKSDNYLKAKNLLLNVVNAAPDSLKENEKENELIASASMRLPSPKHHIIKTLDYKLRLKSGKDGIGYEIGNIKLNIKERGKKTKTLHAEEILKGMEENGKVSMMSETELNEIDMHLQKLIASMQAQLRNTQPNGDN